jgi:hypothetical protein
MRAPLSRHALSLTGHVLMPGERLEHQLMSVPRHGFRGTPESRGPTTFVIRPYDLQVNPNRNEEP